MGLGQRWIVRAGNHGFGLVDYSASLRPLFRGQPACLVTADSAGKLEVVVTYDLLSQDPDTKEVFDLFDPLLRVEGVFLSASWAVELDSNMVDLDIQRGTKIGLPAFGLNLRITYPGIEGAVQPPLAVNVSLGRGSGGPAPTKTLFLVPDTIIDPSSTVDLPIPKMARSVLISNENPAVPTMVVRQKLANEGVIINASPVGKLENGAMIIANGAQFFDVLLDPDVQRMRAIFILKMN